MATILLLSGPEPEPARRARARASTARRRSPSSSRSRRETAAKLGHDVEHVQSNHEGALVDAIHGARGRCAAIVFNPGAFSHYAYAITDALATFDGVKIEVHLSNPHAREEWRHHSVIVARRRRHDHRLQRRRATGSRSKPSPLCWSDVEDE